jgi:hypothetical protein
MPDPRLWASNEPGRGVDDARTVDAAAQSEGRRIHVSTTERRLQLEKR